jgi:hypothetical protein
MDYLTRQLLLELIKLHETYQQQSASANSIQERNYQYQTIQDKRFKEILAAYKKSERYKAIGEKRQHAIQRCICYATWLAATATLLAFIAASVYAGITFRQWQTAKDSLEAQTRPWIAISKDPAEPNVLDINQAGRIAFTIVLRNHGASAGLLANNQRSILVDAGKANSSLFDNRKVCQQSDEELAFRTKVHGFVSSIFPNEDTTFSGEKGVHIQSADAIGDPTEREPPPKITDYNYLLTCISYISQTGAIHHTRAIYAVSIKLMENTFPPPPQRPGPYDYVPKPENYSVTIGERWLYDFQ